MADTPESEAEAEAGAEAEAEAEATTADAGGGSSRPTSDAGGGSNRPASDADGGLDQRLTPVFTRFGVVATLLAIAIVAGFVAFLGGWVPHQPTGPAPWGILISTYVFFVLSCSGLCLVSSLGHVFHLREYQPLARRAIFLGIVMLAVGFLVIFADLTHPMRLIRGAILNPSMTSPMWWMGTFYGFYLVALSAEFALLVRTDFAYKAARTTGLWGRIYWVAALFSRDDTHDRALKNYALAHKAGLLAVSSAIAASSTLGVVFGFIAAKPLWYGPFMPIYFLLSAAVSGAALLPLAIIGTYVLQRRNLDPVREHLQRLGKVLQVVLAVFLFFTVWKTVTGLYGTMPHRFDATMALVTGNLKVGFWGFEVLFGMVVPLLLLRAGRRSVFRVGLAACLVMVGIYAARYDFVVVGQMQMPGQVVDHGPNLQESLVVFVSFACAVLLYMLGERFLPLTEQHPPEELPDWDARSSVPHPAAGSRPPPAKRLPVT